MFSCKNNLPHQLELSTETPAYQYEICKRCGKKYKFKKDSKGRVDNLFYLKLHVADFCQPKGPTKPIYMKIYHPQYTIIRLCLDQTCNKKGLCIHKNGVRQELRVNHKVKGRANQTIWDA